MSKVNNKYSTKSFWCLIVYFEHDMFHIFFIVSIVEFEYINVCREAVS